jgi:predicted nucleic acid-binding protein
MSGVLCDASVIVKWFHAEAEPEAREAHAILAAHRDGALECRVLDLTLYEVGNVFVRSLGWAGRTAADRLHDLMTVVGEPVALSDAARSTAAELAAEHGLSYYDAAYWAAARELRAPLVSADRELVEAGAAESPRQLCQRLELPLG